MTFNLPGVYTSVEEKLVNKCNLVTNVTGKDCWAHYKEMGEYGSIDMYVGKGLDST